MTIEFRLIEIETVAGYIGRCDICDEECTDGYYYQSIRDTIHDLPGCIPIFKGSNCGHKQCLLNDRKVYRAQRMK